MLANPTSIPPSTKRAIPIRMRLTHPATRAFIVRSARHGRHGTHAGDVEHDTAIRARLLHAHLARRTALLLALRRRPQVAFGADALLRLAELPPGTLVVVAAPLKRRQRVAAGEGAASGVGVAPRHGVEACEASVAEACEGCAAGTHSAV